MSKPSSRRNFRKQNPTSLGLTGALGDDGVDSDGDLGGNAEDASNRAQRFATSLEGNRFRELEQQRIQERKQAIARGLIADPDKPTSLENAIEFVGTCTEMCPPFEREEREYKKNVHPLEQKEGQPGRIDPEKAVTMYHRSAAGIDQPLPSDVRTPATLKRTLDYLFHTVIQTQPPELTEPPTPLTALRYTHGFIRDRTRGIRQDFTYQRHVGIMENIECHERIARFHILAIHELAKLEDAQFLKQETEQLNKTLISLIELYDDQRLDGRISRNEPEFRAYQLLSHLNDNEVARTILDLPNEIFSHPHLQLGFTFRSLAQRNFDTQKVGSKYNAEISLNFFSRFFKRVKKRDVPFLIACLAHNKFGDVRRAGIRALMRAYPAPPQSVVLKSGEDPSSMRAMPMGVFVKLMDCRDEGEAMAVADALAVEPYFPRGIDGLDPNLPLGFLINTSADFDDNGDAPPAEDLPEIEAKRHDAAYQDIIDGRLSQATAISSPPRAKLEPRGRVHSTLASAPPAAMSAFSPKPAFAPAPKLAFPTSPSLNASASAFVPSGLKDTSQSSAFPSSAAPPSISSIKQPSIAPPAVPAKAPFAFAPTPGSAPTGEGPSNNVAPASAFSFQPSPSFSRPENSSSAFASKPFLTSTAPTSRPPVETPSTQIKHVQFLPSSNQKKSTHPVKNISSANIDGLAKRLASNAMVSYIGQYVHTVTKRAIDTEQVRRTDLRNKLKSEQRTQLESQLSKGLLNRLVEEIARAEVADAYGEEMWERPLRQKAFIWWRRRAGTKRAQRQRDMQRSVTRGDFGHRIKALTLSALGNPTNEGQARDVSSGSWSVEDVDQDIASSLRKLTKRKAILDEGTFFSVLGSYVCNLSNPDENDLYNSEGVHGNIEWTVVLSVTERPSGTWLRSKFNVAGQAQYAADYHGECRNAKVTAVVDPEVIPNKTGLIVFECSSDVTQDSHRMAQLMNKLPLRGEYQIGLLLVLWQDSGEEWLSTLLGADRKPETLAFVASVNMAQDASDQTFSASLRDALPRISHVAHVEVSMEGPAVSLFDSMRELLSFTDYLLLQNIEDPRNIAHIIGITLKALERLQRHVLDGIVGSFQISLEGYSAITFDFDEPENVDTTENLLDWLVDMLRDAAKGSQHMVAAYEYFSSARQRDHDSLSTLLSRFLDMVNRSILECAYDVHVDITEHELKTLQGLTQQVCEQFKQECTVDRIELAAFAKVQYDRNRVRQTVEQTEEDKQRSELENATQRLKSVLLRSVRENSDSPLLASQQGKKRAYADVEALSPVAGTNEGQEKRQKAVPVASAGAGVDGLSKLRMALAQARTVLKAA